MKKDYTHITIILDESSSMDVVRDSTISNFNELINEQKKVSGEATLSFYKFSNNVNTKFKFSKLKNLANITTTDYVPNGMTALYDAIGFAIDDTGKYLALANESDKPEKVIVVILTDGFENNSKDYTQSKVAEMIKRQTDVYTWQFIFLGANQDAVLAAGKLNIARGSTLNFQNTAGGSQAVYTNVSKKMSDYRSNLSLNCDFTEDERDFVKNAK